MPVFHILKSDFFVDCTVSLNIEYVYLYILQVFIK